MKNVYKVIIITIFNSFLNTNQIYAETKNELSFSLATGNGIMENVKGMHTPVTNNPGTNIKGLILIFGMKKTHIFGLKRLSKKKVTGSTE